MFYCRAVGHLKANCPRLSKSYPFDSNSVADGHVLFYTGPQIDKASRQVEAGLIFNVVNKHQLESVEREACQGIASKDMGSEAGPSLKVKTLNRFKTDSVERQSCHGIDEGLSNKQDANDQNEPPDTVNPDIQGIEGEAAESWEAEYEGSQDPELSRFWETEQGKVTDVQGRLQACLNFWEH